MAEETNAAVLQIAANAANLLDLMLGFKSDKRHTSQTGSLRLIKTA